MFCSSSNAADIFPALLQIWNRFITFTKPAAWSSLLSSSYYTKQNIFSTLLPFTSLNNSLCLSHYTNSRLVLTFCLLMAHVHYICNFNLPHACILKPICLDLYSNDSFLSWGHHNFPQSLFGILSSNRSQLLPSKFLPVHNTLRSVFMPHIWSL
jgi:hypothetical protein